MSSTAGPPDSSYRNSSEKPSMDWADYMWESNTRKFFPQHVRSRGVHIPFVELHLKTTTALMEDMESSSLQRSTRHYIALIACSRHRCEYLARLQLESFLNSGGDTTWLSEPPEKLKSLHAINCLLAHQPWMITADHIKDLMQSKWSKSELLHALCILAHFHAESSFVFGASFGIEDPLDVDDLNWVDERLPKEEGGNKRPAPSEGDDNSPNSFTGAMCPGAGTGTVVDVNSASPNLSNLSMGDRILDSSNTFTSQANSNSQASLRSAGREQVIQQDSNSSPKSSSPRSHGGAATAGDDDTAASLELVQEEQSTPPRKLPEVLVPYQNENDESTTHFSVEAMKRLPSCFAKNMELWRDRAMFALTEDQQKEVVEAGDNVMSEEVFQDVGKFENRDVQLSHEERMSLKTVMDAAPRKLTARVCGRMQSIIASKSAPTVSQYSDFGGRKGTDTSHACTWEDDAYVLLAQFCPVVADAINEEHEYIQSYTSGTVGGKKVVSSIGIRRATMVYVLRMYGLVQDDFNYGKLNHHITLIEKVFVKKLVCFPERVTRADYRRVMEIDGFNLEDMIHYMLICCSARRTMGLQYVTHAMMKYQKADR